MTRRRLDVVAQDPFPAYVVWELTLRCDHACTHCGSRAARPRKGELTTAEALEVVDQVADLGAREVALIGGEAYLHEGVTEIITALRDHGVDVAMTTGGRGIDGARARALAEAGLQRASVSIDGLASTHDRIRAARGSFASATAALKHLHDAGVRTGSNINVNRLNVGELEAVYDHLRERNVTAWQVQLTVPLGRAADRPALILQPYDLVELVPRIAALKQRAYDDGILLMPGNNLGYFGPEEALLRSYDAGGSDYFAGCQAGRFVMGIESDGGIKGCPSLQSHAYVTGNVRQTALVDLWRDGKALTAHRADRGEQLWGFCRTCPFASTCRGGCTFTAHAILGRPGNNPYCHYRARTLARQGLRERLVLVRSAPGRPFDHGQFEAVVEPWDSPQPLPSLGDALVPVQHLHRT